MVSATHAHDWLARRRLLLDRLDYYRRHIERAEFDIQQYRDWVAATERELRQVEEALKCSSSE